MTKKFTVETTENERIYRVHARGRDVIGNRILNKGTAFTQEERKSLKLSGLVPPVISTIEEQAARVYEAYRSQPSDISKNVYLTSLHDRNATLYYYLLTQHLHEMLPIVYDPVIGDAIENYSHLYRRPFGVFLSIDHPEDIRASFENLDMGSDEVDLIVASDAEEILGIGDWGVAGIEIAAGKLAVYTAAAGIDPTRVIPVSLDVGTDNKVLLADPLYLGNRHPRIRGEKYDAFIEEYVSVVSELFPQALLHWEDFGPGNGRRILEKYRPTHCTFNDDMQGTGAIALSAVITATRRIGGEIGDHRVVVFGSGTAGIGFADQIRDLIAAEKGISLAEASEQIWCIDKQGLLLEEMEDLRDFQTSYAKPQSEVADWTEDGDTATGTGYSLLETIRQVKPSILIGTSTVPGAFTEEIIRTMSANCERPIILTLSNPTKLIEARPAQVIEWSNGKALTATGAPFDPVQFNGVTYTIGQANNAMLYPGLGLGCVTVKATQITDGMFAAASRAVADLVTENNEGSPILPLVDDLREVSRTVAEAVGRQAIEEGVARIIPDDLKKSVRREMWDPRFARYVAV
tara:strand:- start:81 stop:1805 length:1725 start_codon:yes stop_codon:yes gene_type:complete